MKKRFYSIFLAFFALGLITMVSCSKDDSDPVPTPNFTFEINDKTVTFTNTSTDATSYSWNFGDESAVSAETNPVHEYAAYGDYDVRLTAIGPGGEKILKQTISVSKDWPAISIDGNFDDWDAVESFYVAGPTSGTLVEAKVTSEASTSKIYIYLKGTINADFPVIQVLIDADGNSATGWDTPLDYATNGAEYQFEFFALDGWGGLYGWSADEAVQDWPWVDDLTSDPEAGVITETSGVIGESEIEFVIETSLMKAPVVADEIGIYFWQQPSDWSATSGSLPGLMADPLESIKKFSFQ
jgi:PKD repeat protein